jgi:ATP synthase F1 delta subunit
MLIGQLVIIQVLTFIVLILFLRLLFYRHLSSALARLKRLNEENLAREETLKQELERAKREREAEIAKGREEAKNMIEQAKGEAEKFKDESFAQTREKVKTMITEAERRGKRIEEESMRKLEERTLEFSCEMVKHIFKGKGRDALHRELIDELIEEIKTLDKQKLKTSETQAQLYSAYPLSSEQKKRLEDILSSKMGNTIILKEEIDKDIITGIVVKIGTLVIDGSLKNKLRRIVPYLKK